MKQAMQVLTSSETVEWYTPPVYIDAVKRVLGTIDLDPASNEAANRWIRAKRIFTAQDDGLSQPWHGRVFLNPPYGVVYGRGGCRSNQEIWADKLIAEYEAGRVTEAIMLTKTVPGYTWWENLFKSWPVCFVRERIYFLQIDQHGLVVENGKAKAGTSFWYFGPTSCRCLFREIFSQFGRVIYQEHNA